MKMPKVDSAYGAPMGRHSYGVNPVSKVRVFRVALDSGGYDNGGAYWGTGKALWCARDDEGDYVQYVRADSRLKACVLLRLDVLDIKVPPVAEFLKLARWLNYRPDEFRNAWLKECIALGFGKYLKNEVKL